MKSDNNLVKIMTLGRIKKDLEQYFERQEKFTLVDLRLFNGLM